MRLSREGSSSASRVIDVLKSIKSPKQIKVPKETLDMIDKVIRRKMHPFKISKSARSNSRGKSEKESTKAHENQNDQTKSLKNLNFLLTPSTEVSH